MTGEAQCFLAIMAIEVSFAMKKFDVQSHAAAVTDEQTIPLSWYASR
jgi:hypothetical protein